MNSSVILYQTIFLNARWWRFLIGLTLSTNVSSCCSPSFWAVALFLSRAESCCPRELNKGYLVVLALCCRQLWMLESLDNQHMPRCWTWRWSAGRLPSQGNGSDVHARVRRSPISSASTGAYCVCYFLLLPVVHAALWDTRSFWISVRSQQVYRFHNCQFSCLISWIVCPNMAQFRLQHSGKSAVVSWPHITMPGNYVFRI